MTDNSKGSGESKSLFSRWAKRKADVQAESESVAGTAAKINEKKRLLQTPEDLSVDPNELAKQNTNPSIGGSLEAKVPEEARPELNLPFSKSEELSSLPSVESLTSASDFAPFMQPNVAPGLRNLAMKKLFTDPHYNVMDGLDIYIDDYGKPDPIPPEMLRMMHQSKALGLFDDEETERVAETPIVEKLESNAAETNPAAEQDKDVLESNPISAVTASGAATNAANDQQCAASEGKQ